MRPWPFKSAQRAQISLSALLMMSCLLLLATGPFQAARIYLRGDMALHMARTNRHYEEHVTHVMRRESEPGHHAFEFESILIQADWQELKNASLNLNLIRAQPVEDLGWPEMISLWLTTADYEIELRGTYEIH